MPDIAEVPEEYNDSVNCDEFWLDVQNEMLSRAYLEGIVDFSFYDCKVVNWIKRSLEIYMLMANYDDAKKILWPF